METTLRELLKHFKSNMGYHSGFNLDKNVDVLDSALEAVDANEPTQEADDSPLLDSALEALEPRQVSNTW